VPGKKGAKDNFEEVLSVYGNNLRGYLKKGIDDDAYLNSLEKKAQSFSVEGHPIRIALRKNRVFDLGGFNANESAVAAAIDLDLSKDLTDYLSQRLSYDANSGNTIAVFLLEKNFDVAMSKKFRAPTLMARQRVVVITLEKGEAIAVHILRNSGLRAF
jgi:hypothetical protein